jgi:hypothetical protein
VANVGNITNGASAAIADPFYVPYDIKSKRFRRSNAAVAGIRTAINILSEDHPQTVRQVSERELLTAWAATYGGTPP